GADSGGWLGGAVTMGPLYGPPRTWSSWSFRGNPYVTVSPPRQCDVSMPARSGRLQKRNAFWCVALGGARRPAPRASSLVRKLPEEPSCNGVLAQLSPGGAFPLEPSSPRKAACTSASGRLGPHGSRLR